MPNLLKWFDSVARWLFILCLPALLVTASVSLAMNCNWLYNHGFEKYNVGRVTGLEDSQLEKASRGLISYFNSGEEYIDLVVMKDGRPFPLFNDREIEHLKDVKALFHLVYKMLSGSVIYFILFAGLTLFRRNRVSLGWGLFGGGVLTLALMIALGVAIAVGFDRVFLQFHLLSFANDFWMLDPSRDYLIMLFPQGFWFDATLYIVLGTAAGAVVLGGLGWWLKKRKSEDL